MHGMYYHIVMEDTYYVVFRQLLLGVRLLQWIRRRLIVFLWGGIVKFALWASAVDAHLFLSRSRLNGY